MSCVGVCVCGRGNVKACQSAAWGVCNDGVCGAFAMSPIKSTRTVEKNNDEKEWEEQEQEGD